MEAIYQSRFQIRAGVVPLLICRDLPVPHGFSTRLGGVSRGGGRDTLDLGRDDGTPEVAENRRRFAAALEIGAERLIYAKQRHSATVETVTEADLGRAFACDGFVTDRPGLLLTVKTADCVPILLADPVRGVIGAVHAGWRGTVAGIVGEAIERMAAFGARPRDVIAAIGPCIHAECFEVDEPFCEAVAASACGPRLTDHIRPLPGKAGRYTADLVGMNRQLLLEAGLTEAHIAATGFCTGCAPELFYSHRVCGTERGLMMAGIRLP